MKLTYSAAVVRLFLPWRTSCACGHDVDHPGITEVAEAINNNCRHVYCVDTGSGHTGMYFDVSFTCRPEDLPARIAEVREYASTLQVKPVRGRVASFNS